MLLASVALLCACAAPTPTYKVRVSDAPAQVAKEPTQRSYEVNGTRYQPIPSAVGYTEEGVASWYGDKFHGRKTSNGEIYDMHAMTAAHKTLPMNVHLKVTNLANNRSTVVRVNDRGPFVKNRIIDLSYSAAKELDVVGPGTAPVRIEALGYRDKVPGGTVPSYHQPASYEVGPFMIQVGAFTVQENAQRLAAKLKSRFGSASIAEGVVSGQKFYRVRVGLYASMTLATAALLTVEADGYSNSFIVAQ